MRSGDHRGDRGGGYHESQGIVGTKGTGGQGVELVEARAGERVVTSSRFLKVRRTEAHRDCNASRHIEPPDGSQEQGDEPDQT